MAIHSISHAAAAFTALTASFDEIALRPEVRWEPVRAPSRLAPHTYAAEAEVVVLDDEVASGRLVVLHDPAGVPEWKGTHRLVALAKARLEPEFATEALLGDVAWSWATESLEFHGAAAHALGCTVTRVVSQSYGAMAARPTTVDVELRASWTPDDPELLGQHFAAWTELLCAAGGLPPAPPGVTAIRRARQARPLP